MFAGVPPGASAVCARTVNGARCSQRHGSFTVESPFSSPIQCQERRPKIFVRLAGGPDESARSTSHPPALALSAKSGPRIASGATVRGEELSRREGGAGGHGGCRLPYSLRRGKLVG